MLRNKLKVVVVGSPFCRFKENSEKKNKRWKKLVCHVVVLLTLSQCRSKSLDKIVNLMLISLQLILYFTEWLFCNLDMELFIPFKGLFMGCSKVT